MKKIISLVLAFAMIITMVNIPVVGANTELVNITADYSAYTADTSVNDWKLVTPGATATFGPVDGGVEMKQVNSKILNDSNAKNGNFSPYYNKFLETKTVDEENGTVLTLKELQGVYDIIIDYSYKTISPANTDSLTFGGEYFGLYIGQASPDDTEYSFNDAAINLRFRGSDLYVANSSSNGSNKMSPKTLGYSDTTVEKHTVKVTLDTINKDVTVKLDNNDSKVSTGDFFNDIDSFNAITICAMERLANDSYFRFEKIQVIERESEASTATHSVVDSLPAKLSDNINEVTADLAMPEATTGVTWTSSNPDVVSSLGKVTRPETDTEVTLTATVDLENDGGVYTKDYTMTVLKAEEPEPLPPATLYSFEENYKAYTSDSQLSGWTTVAPSGTDNNGKTISSLGIVTGEGYKMAQQNPKFINSATAQNGNMTPEIHKNLGSVVEDTANRTVLRHAKLQGKYEVEVDYSAKVVDPTIEDAKALGYTGTKWYSAYYYMTLGGMEDPGSESSAVTDMGIADIRMRVGLLNCTYALKNVDGYEKDQNLNFDVNVEKHSLKFTVDTAEKTTIAQLDGDQKFIIPFISEVDYFNTLSIKGMERLALGSYLTVERLKVSQFETEEAKATLAVVNALPATLVADPSNVTENITMPEAINGVTWTSSDTTVVAPDGTVTRAAEDKEVVITATVDLENNGGVYVKEYTLTVPKSEIPSGGDEGGEGPELPPVVDSNLIVVEKDFTQYSDISEIDNLLYGNESYATVKAVKGKGIVIDQHSSAPLADGKVNGAQSPNVVYYAETTFNEDAENRTNYRIDRFSGKYKITIDFNVLCDAYAKPVDGVTITAPFYLFSVTGINPATAANNLAPASTGLIFRVKSNNSSVLNSTSASANTISPSAIYFTKGADHTVVMDVDTNTKDVSVNINGGAASTGTLVKNGYLNGFAISGMERMQAGSYFAVRSIKFEQTEEDADTTAVREALDKLPASLVENPYAVTENIAFPAVEENITWRISDPSIITPDGIVNRWYDDREVTITAVATSGSMAMYKDYIVTVKAFDDFYSKELMNKSGEELEGIIVSGDPVSGSAKVLADGITVAKTTDGTAADKETEVFCADYRLFGKEVEYSESTKSSVDVAGFAGTYDVNFKVTPSVSGDKPIYIALGTDGSTYEKAAALRITKDGFYIVHKDGTDCIYSGDTAKAFDIRFRVDTDNKNVWIFVDGKLAGTAYNFENADIINSIRVILDKNNSKNDKVTVNNIAVTELVRNDIQVRNALVSALDNIKVSNITDTPDSVESIKTLPATAGGYDITWSCDSKQIDLVNGKVYYGETANKVIVTATIDKAGVYVKKNFVLNVRASANRDETLDYYLSDLEDTITKQNANDIRYDLALPTEHNGLAIQWLSDSEIIDINGKINRNIAITSPTVVTLTAKVTMDGTTTDREYKYTVAPRAYENVVYTGASDVENIVVNGVGNIKITRGALTNVKFKQTGNGSIVFADDAGNKFISVNVNSGMLNVSYGNTVSESYQVAEGVETNLHVMTMPDIDRVAVWLNGTRIVDFGETIDEVKNLAMVAASGAVEVTETTITTDEYGLLDINLANVGYFDIFAKNVVKENVSLISDTVAPANVQWKSSNTDIISNSGVVTLPSMYQFADMTLTLTSTKDANVKRIVTKKIAVACDPARNLAYGADVSTSVTEKPGFVKVYITDGDLNTTYGTSYVNKKPTLTLDLGESVYFNSIFVNENFATYQKSLKSYTVSYSEDGENWTVAKTGTINGIESALIGFDTVKARYVKFTAEECDSKELYINEIEVYLFVTSTELMKLDVDVLDLNLGYTVTEDIILPVKGQFGTDFTWKSSHPDVISAEGKVTRPSENTTVTLIVTGEYNGETYSREFSAYVPAKSTTGAKPVGGSGGSGGGGGSAGGMGTGTSALPGFVETDIDETQQAEPDTTVVTFADLTSTHWAYENVMKLKELGIINGVGDNKFDPSGKVTREQFLKMLVEAAELETGVVDTKFDDVDKNSWYAPYVSAGVNAGLINGITAETFGVGDEIRRQDMAVMIVRILKSKNITLTQTSEVFDDDNNISDYAKDAVYMVRDAGIVQGYDNKFNPKDTLTRAEAATVIVKLLDILQ